MKALLALTVILFSTASFAEDFRSTYMVHAESWQGYMQLYVSGTKASGKLTYTLHGRTGDLVKQSFYLSNASVEYGPGNTMILEWARPENYQIFKVAFSEARDHFAGTFVSTRGGYTMPIYGNKVVLKPRR